MSFLGRLMLRRSYLYIHRGGKDSAFLPWRQWRLVVRCWQATLHPSRRFAGMLRSISTPKTKTHSILHCCGRSMTKRPVIKQLNGAGKLQRSIPGKNVESELWHSIVSANRDIRKGYNA